MKRVIDGEEYNTDTAIVVATTGGQYEWMGFDWTYQTTLYKMLGGAWFLVTIEYTAGVDPKYTDEISQTLMPLKNLDAAIDWVNNTDCVIEHPEYFPPIKQTSALAGIQTGQNILSPEDVRLINDNASNAVEAFALLKLIAAAFQTDARGFDAEIVERVRRCVERRQEYERRLS